MVTPGRYFFAPDSTPCYPGQHNLWSWNWVTDDFAERQPALGEVKPASTWSRPWRNGRLNVPMPPARLIGSAECIRDGETLPLPVLPRTLIGGIDSRCWPIPPQGTEGGVAVGGAVRDLAEENVSGGIAQGGAVADPDSPARGGVATGGSSRDWGGEKSLGGYAVGGRTVEGPVYMGCAACPLGTYAVRQVTLSGCTGDFTSLNGTWRMTVLGPGSCTWAGGASILPISAVYALVGTATLSIGDTGGAMASVLYRAAISCVGTIVLTAVSSVGVGTFPATATVVPG